MEEEKQILILLLFYGIFTLFMGYLILVEQIGYHESVLEFYSLNAIASGGFSLTNIFYWIKVILILLPTIVIFFAWIQYGMEHKVKKQCPEELSRYPNERKAWEVNVFFNSLFGKVDKSFVPTMLVDFYRRKIIDLKEEKGDLLVKIYSAKEDMDEVESKFLEFLALIKGNGLNEEYFSVRKDAKRTDASRKKIVEIKSLIDKCTDQYCELKGGFFVTSFFLIHLITSFYLFYSLFPYFSAVLIVFSIVVSLIAFVIASTTTLFSRFNDGYYEEYLQWQSFKRYLSNSYSMKASTHEGITVWDNYLVYACALGVGEKVMSSLKVKEEAVVKDISIFSLLFDDFWERQLSFRNRWLR